MLRCRVGDEDRRVYISTWPPEAARYRYDCEVRVGPQDTDYDSVQSGDTRDPEQVVSVVEAHLGEFSPS